MTTLDRMKITWIIGSRTFKMESVRVIPSADLESMAAIDREIAALQAKQQDILKHAFMFGEPAHNAEEVPGADS